MPRNILASVERVKLRQETGEGVLLQQMRQEDLRSYVVPVGMERKEVLSGWGGF